MKTLFGLALVLFGHFSIHAAVLSSSLDAGGQRSSGSQYTLDGSFGNIATIATAPFTTSKSGYVSQLTEIVGLQVAGTPDALDEGESAQLGGVAALDDGTVSIIPGAEISWATASFPFESLNSSGYAKAASVYQDTNASFAGSYFGRRATGTLLVKDSNPDNFGSYGTDGLPDAWQIQYFGLPPNAAAGPEVDAFETGQNNLFKYIAGLNPTNALSIFHFHIRALANEPGVTQLYFAPRLPDRSYEILYVTNFNHAAWISLQNLEIVDDDTTRTVIVRNPHEPDRFYRLRITKP